MPLAEDSIIAPGSVNAKAPLKKSTIAWLGAGVLLLAVIGVAAPALFGGSQKEQPAPEPKKEAPPQVGRPQTIDSEFEEGRRRAAYKKALDARQASTSEAPSKEPAAAPAPAGTVQTNPVPEDVRRTNQAGAFYDRPGRAGAASRAGAEADAELELDAAGRTSKSIAFDDGGSISASLKPGGEERVKSNLPSEVPVALAGGESRSKSPSALDALLQAQAAQPSGAPRSADREWLKELAAESGTGTNKPLRPYGVTSRYTVLQGKVLPAVLMRDINTDLPGEIAACLTLDVYDSISSDYLLMPKGSCLVGQYSSSIRPGQSRVLFAFNRLIMPNGMSFDLPAAPGADLGGAAGVAGEVNNHFFRMFTTSFLIAWLANRAESGSQASSTTTTSETSGAKTAAGQVLVDTSRTILERDKIIAPTITVRKGERINVEVTRDMEFPGPYRK